MMARELSKLLKAHKSLDNSLVTPIDLEEARKGTLARGTKKGKIQLSTCCCLIKMNLDLDSDPNHTNEVVEEVCYVMVSSCYF